MELSIDNRPWRHALPTVLAGGWIVVDLVLLGTSYLPNRELPTDWWFAFVVGLVFAQLAYGGFWIAFGPTRASIRLPLVLGGGALAAAAFFRQFVYQGELLIQFLVFFLGLFVLFQFVIIGGGLLIKSLCHWKVMWQGIADQSRRYQFGVRDLLIWMSGIGVLIPMFRWAFSDVTFPSDLDSTYLLFELFFVSVVLLTSLAQAFLVGRIVFCSHVRHRWLWGVVAGLVVAAIGAIPLGGSWTNYLVIMLQLTTEFAFLSGCLSLLCLNGLRLVDQDVSIVGPES